MVFSSLPPYLDPSNWHQNQQHQLAGNGSNDLNPQLSTTPPPQSQVQQPHLGGSIRPGSMSDRARVANLMPETALKCPRCESTNTKFCYFNNYSLSQPRHFCKTCRRYWTRGGALRNVPVGGGCRRNKRSKPKSSASTGHASSACANSASTSLVLPNNNNSSTAVAADILSLAPQLRFMSPFQHLTDFTANGDMGLNYNGILGAPSVASDMNFPIGISNLLGSGGGSSSSSFLMGGGVQQFPFMNGGGGGGELIESQTMGLYPLDQVEDGGGFEQPGCVGVRPNYKINGSSALSQQLASVKIEDGNNNANYRSRHGYYLLNDHLQQQNYYWNGGSGGGGGGAAAWTDLSAGFSSSSATNSNPI